MSSQDMTMFYKSGRILYDIDADEIVYVSDTNEYHVYYYAYNREDDFSQMCSKPRQEMCILFRDLPDEIEKILLLQ
jgi:hypothetical protein